MTEPPKGDWMIDTEPERMPRPYIWAFEGDCDSHVLAFNLKRGRVKRRLVLAASLGLIQVESSYHNALQNAYDSRTGQFFHGLAEASLSILRR